MKRPTVVFITIGLGIGGAQKMICFVANEYAKAGYEVSLICVNKSKLVHDLHADIKVIYLDINWKAFTELPFVKKRFKALHIILKIRKEIAKINPEIAVVFIFDLIKLVRISLIGKKTRIIAAERDNPYEYNKKQKRSADKTYAKCDWMVFQTTKAKEAFNEVIQNKSSVIPNPCIAKKNDIIPFIGERSKYFIGAGSLVPHKRFDLLIEAFVIVHNRFPSYRLHIFGEGSERTKLEKMIEEKALAGTVVLKGAVDDVFKTARDGYAFVLSSKTEGIPNVLIEAMAAGIPCIATDCEPGGPRQLLQNGKRGVLVPVDDVNKLAKAMCQYILHPEIARENGRQGLLIRNELDATKIGQMWLQLI